MSDIFINSAPNPPKPYKRVILSYLEKIYSKKIMHNIKAHLLPINKEESRDRLTELGFSF